MKRKTSFKSAGQFVLICLLVVAMVACSSNKGTNNSSPEPETTGQPDATQTPVVQEEKIAITAMISEEGRERGLKIDLEYNKRMNVDTDWTLVPAPDYINKLKVMLASGDIPDLVYTNKSIVDQFGPQGYFVDLYPYLDKMTNLQRWAKKYPGIINEVLTGDKKMYGINNFNTRGQFPMGLIFRDDLFKENGIAEPKTMDELYNALVTLKAKYPDSIPIVLRFGAINLFFTFMYAYRTDAGIYLNLDELQYKFGPVEENYKKAVADMAKFYKAKLIDPEFATLSNDQYEERITNGQAIITNDYFSGITAWTAKGKEANPNYSLKPMLPPKTSTGQMYVFVQYPTGGGSYMASINAKSKHIDRLVQLLDKQLTDEIIELTNWGIEGDTFTVENGQRKYSADLKFPNNPNGTIEPKSIGLDSRTGMWVPIDQDAWDAQLPDVAGAALYKEHADEIGYFKGTPLQFTTAETEEINLVMAPINTYLNESLLKFITGSWTIEANWDEFQKQLESLNYKKVLHMHVDKYNALPDDQKGVLKDIGAN